MEESLTRLKRKTITIEPPARCARHDIILSSQIRTNIMTLGKCSNHHIWPRFRSDWGQDTSDSGCLRRKRCDTNWREDIIRFSGNEPRKQVPKQEFIIKPRRGWGGGWWTQRPFIEIFQKDGFPQLWEQGVKICQIKWYNEVCSRKTYTIKHWLKGAPVIWVGLHDQCQNGDSIINSQRMNGRPLTSKQ